MKPSSLSLMSFLRRVTQDKEAQICFGAATMCALIGLVGLVVNVIFSSSTTLEALLVVSVFYGLAGMIRTAQLHRELVRERSLIVDNNESRFDRHNARTAA